MTRPYYAPPRPNPWWSPPALQYVARFTNPPGPEPMPFLEWKEPYRRGYGELDYLEGYTGAPGYDDPSTRANPPFNAGARVTWTEEALDMGTGRRGQVLRVTGPSLHEDDADRTPIETESGHRRMVNNWEIKLLPASAPSMPWNNPYEDVRGMGQEGFCPQCGKPFLMGDRVWYDPNTDKQFCCKHCSDTYVLGPASIGRKRGGRRRLAARRNPEFHAGGGSSYGGRYHPGGGRKHHGAFHPGGGRRHKGSYRPGGGHYERNPEARHDVLCQCGWGRMGMLESEIPEHCPVCNHRLARGGHSDEFWEGVQAEQEDWDDPSLGAAYGDNPGGFASGAIGPYDKSIFEKVEGTEDCITCGITQHRGDLITFTDEGEVICESCWLNKHPWGNNPRHNPKYFSMTKGPKPFSRGTLRRTMETDPMHENRMRGMLGFYGKKHFGVELTNRQVESMLGKGRKELKNRTATAKRSVKGGTVNVGKRKVKLGSVRKGQKVKLGDIKARVDAVFYSQSRGMGTLAGVSIAEETVPEAPQGRKPARKIKLKPKRKKAKKKRKAANPPKSGARCVSKKKNGQRCKGKRHPGEQTCVFHTPRFAPRR